MGKEWYWSRSNMKEERERRGCLRGMFHFFDFHHILFTGGCRNPAAASSPPPELQKPQQLHYSSDRKGVEAPRNSLQLEESVEAIREEYYGVPIGIQIVAPKKKKQPPFTEEERRNSQAVTPRTRSIVARLMGLEVFEIEGGLTNIVAGGHESASAALLISVSKSKETSKNTDKRKKKKHIHRDCGNELPSPRRPLQKLNSNILGSISLPDTPRASSEKARDAGPRYSLQFNKENDCRAAFQELDNLRKPSSNRSFPVSPAIRFSKPRKDCYAPLPDENNSPPRSQYFAREIVKNIKDGISKRQAGNIGFSSENKPSEKKALNINHDNIIMVKLPTLVPKPLPKNRVSRDKIKAKVVKMERGICMKARCERFIEKIKRQSPPGSLAGEQPQLSTTKNIFSYITPIKEAAPQAALRLEPQLKEEDPEFKYVKAIFARAGVVGTKALKWFSSSLPIDPSIFHILELRFPFEHGEDEAAARFGPLRHRWNRKLLFHIVEEILGDLLLSVPNPCDSEKLLSRLWSQIRGLPSADCRMIGDIDALVVGDLAESKVRRLMLHACVVAEAKDVAAEIERDILDSLLGDAAASLVEHEIVGLTSRYALNLTG